MSAQGRTHRPSDVGAQLTRAPSWDLPPTASISCGQSAHGGRRLARNSPVLGRGRVTHIGRNVEEMHSQTDCVERRRTRGRHGLGRSARRRRSRRWQGPWRRRNRSRRADDRRVDGHDGGGVGEAIVFDSDQVADIVGDALAEPEVEAALADYVTEQVFAAVDVDAVVSNALPDDLDRLEPVIVAGVTGCRPRRNPSPGPARRCKRSSPRSSSGHTAERWNSSKRTGSAGRCPPSTARSRSTCCRSSAGASPGCRSSGSSRTWRSPTSPPMVTPNEQIADLEQATGRDLPDDFGQLVVYSSDQLAERQASLESAQQVVALAKRAVWLLGMLTTVLLVATVLVARNRWRAALWLGVGGAGRWWSSVRSSTESSRRRRRSPPSRRAGRHLSHRRRGVDESAQTRWSDPHSRRRSRRARNVPPALAAR